MSTSNESALNLHSYAVKMMVKISDFTYLVLLITVYMYTPSIFCITVFNMNGKYHPRKFKTKISDRSNVCCILVVLFHFLHAQANKQKQIIFIFYQENNLH